LYRFNQILLSGIETELPPRIVTSEDLELRLDEFYQRCNLHRGRLELMSGIKERRFWEKGTRPSQGAIKAGQKVLKSTNIDPNEIDALIFSSVSRDFLEPATASVVHEGLGISKNAMIFDISNACLGFLNGLITLGNMIELGQINHGMVVSSESGGPLVDQTIERILNDKSMTRNSFKGSFASLTIGSGAVAAIVSNSNIITEGIKILGATSRAATEYVKLCQGGVDDSVSETSSGFQDDHQPDMQTDSEAMLHAGCTLAKENWESLKNQLDWTNETPNHFICHQVGRAHQKLLFDKLDLDVKKDFSTYELYGNTGSAALPMALCKALQENKIAKNDKLAFLGIGSGLNSLMFGAEKI